jgi:hypothetical protein
MFQKLLLWCVQLRLRRPDRYADVLTIKAHLALTRKILRYLRGLPTRLLYAYRSVKAEMTGEHHAATEDRILESLRLHAASSLESS